MRLSSITRPSLTVLAVLALSTGAFAQGSQPASAPASAPAPAPAPSQGSLSVSSSPSGAKVFIDGSDTGKVTPVVDLAVAPGNHDLKVVMNGREKVVTFHLEAGAVLSLNLNLPEPVGGTGSSGNGSSSQPASQPSSQPSGEGGDTITGKVDPNVEPGEADPTWTWMTVAGWTGLGLGTMGIVAGSVVLATQGDQEQGPLGFGLFGAGAGLILGGGVLLYLDEELNREGEDAVATIPVLVPVTTASR